MTNYNPGDGRIPATRTTGIFPPTFDFRSASRAAERFDLDEVRWATAGFSQMRSPKAIGRVCHLRLESPPKALAGFEEVAEIIGNQELVA